MMGDFSVQSITSSQLNAIMDLNGSTITELGVVTYIILFHGIILLILMYP